MSETLRFSLSDPAQAGKRLDAVLAAAFPALSRSRLQALMRQGQVLVDGVPARPRQPAVQGQEVVITVPPAQPAALEGEAMDLTILHEDADLIVLDKPSGLVVHPGAGHSSGTLVHALLAHCGGLSTIGGEERPGIVHRLDKDTSGCIVIAKNDETHADLSAQFAARQVEKHYLAVVRGRLLPPSGRVENHLGRHPGNRQKMAVVEASRGKPATTDYDAGPFLQGGSLVHCHLHTGRTHQIRVHMHSLGHPLLGDSIYGAGRGGTSVARLLLHAWILGFRHPRDRRPLVLRSQVPAVFDPWLTDREWLRAKAEAVEETARARWSA